VTTAKRAGRGLGDRLLREQDFKPLSLSKRRVDDLMQTFGVAELLLPPDSELDGQNLRQASFRSRQGLNVLAIRRQGAMIEGALAEAKLAPRGFRMRPCGAPTQADSVFALPGWPREP